MSKENGTNFRKIIFVSDDDTYRSPVAAALMKKRADKTPVEIKSRGAIVLFPEPANAKGVLILKEKGINISKHFATQLENEDFGEKVIVLVMTEKIKKMIYDRFKNAVNVYTLKEFVGTSGDVETPYGKSLTEYRENVEMIKSLVNEAASILSLKGAEI